MGNIPRFWRLSCHVSTFLYQSKVFNLADRVKAAKKWVPILIGLMAGAFAAYMALKGLKKIWKPSSKLSLTLLLSFLVFWVISIPYISKVSSTLTNEKRDINSLFNLPLIAGVALLTLLMEPMMLLMRLVLLQQLCRRLAKKLLLRKLEYRFGFW